MSLVVASRSKVISFSSMSSDESRHQEDPEIDISADLGYDAESRLRQIRDLLLRSSIRAIGCSEQRGNPDDTGAE